MKKINLINHIFERLVVVGEAPPRRIGGVQRRYWICNCNCGRKMEAATGDLRSGHVRSCGCLAKEFLKMRTGDRHPTWKGGRSRTSEGYIYLTRPKFPGCGAEGQPARVLEHVVIMARHLGRPLCAGETVHHKNGVKDDNCIENLELWAANHPAGQRVGDLVDWAKELLQKYCPEALK